MTRWSDRRLIERILGGDREAVAQLVGVHHAAIYRFLHRLCPDAHRAEDLTQETFAAAWSRLGGFNGTASLASWLHRIAYCKFVDAYRKCRRTVPVEAGPRIEEVSDPSRGPEETVLADEESLRIRAALDRLEDSDREVIALHYFQDFSFRDMAEILDISVGLAKWRTSRALAKLRKILGEA